MRMKSLEKAGEIPAKKDYRMSVRVKMNMRKENQVLLSGGERVREDEQGGGLGASGESEWGGWTELFGQKP